MSATLDSNSEASEFEETTVRSSPLLPSKETVATLTGETAGTMRTRTWSSGKRTKAPQPPIDTNKDEENENNDSNEENNNGSEESNCDDDSLSDCGEYYFKRDGAKNLNANKKGFKESLQERFATLQESKQKIRRFLCLLLVLLLLMLSLLFAMTILARFAKSDKGSAEGKLAKLEKKDSTLLLLGGMAPGDEHLSILKPMFKGSFESNMMCSTQSASPVSLLHGHTSSYIALREEIVVCGGEKEGRVSNRCFRYALKSNTWSEIRAMDIEIKFAAAIIIKDFREIDRSALVIMGGLSQRFGPIRRAQKLDLTSMTWSPYRDLRLPDRRFGHCGAVARLDQDEVVVVAGGQTLVPDLDASKAILIRHKFEKFARIATLRHARKHHGCLATLYKEKEPVLVVAGGSDMLSRPVMSVELVSLVSSHTVRQLGSLSRPRSASPSVVLLNNRLLVAGGGERRSELYAGSNKGFVIADGRRDLRSAKAFAASVVVPNEIFLRRHDEICASL